MEEKVGEGEVVRGKGGDRSEIEVDEEGYRQKQMTNEKSKQAGDFCLFCVVFFTIHVACCCC